MPPPPWSSTPTISPGTVCRASQIAVSRSVSWRDTNTGSTPSARIAPCAFAPLATRRVPASSSRSASPRPVRSATSTSVRTPTPVDATNQFGRRASRVSRSPAAPRSSGWSPARVGPHSTEAPRRSSAVTNAWPRRAAVTPTRSPSMRPSSHPGGYGETARGTAAACLLISASPGLWVPPKRGKPWTGCTTARSTSPWSSARRNQATAGTSTTTASRCRTSLPGHRSPAAAGRSPRSSSAATSSRTRGWCARSTTPSRRWRTATCCWWAASSACASTWAFASAGWSTSSGRCMAGRCASGVGTTRPCRATSRPARWTTRCGSGSTPARSSSASAASCAPASSPTRSCAWAGGYSAGACRRSSSTAPAGGWSPSCAESWGSPSRGRPCGAPTHAPHGRPRLGEPQLSAHEGDHPPAGAVDEDLLHAPAEYPPAQAHDRVGDDAGAHEAADAELDLAGVEPLPHLVIHLAGLEVALQGLVVPTPDAHLPAMHLPLLVDHPADSNAHVEAQAEEAAHQQHVAVLQRRLGVVDRAHQPRVRELVAADELLGDLPAAAGDRWPGRLVRQRLAVVVDVPAVA